MTITIDGTAASNNWPTDQLLRPLDDAPIFVKNADGDFYQPSKDDGSSEDTSGGGGGADTVKKGAKK